VLGEKDADDDDDGPDHEARPDGDEEPLHGDAFPRHAPQRIRPSKGVLSTGHVK